MKKRILSRIMMLIAVSAITFSACGTAAVDTGSTAVIEEETPEEGAKEEVEEEIAPRAPEWTKDAVLYEVNLRQYTKEGTFKAFSGHLDEIKSAGFNTLWFMPIHPISKTNRAGSLGSYYSVSDYRDVNPEYGNLEDFKALCEKAHKMGFHIMLDWVANHTGWDNPWIKAHPDWYTQKDGEIISPEGTGWNDVADLNYDNPDMRKEMIESMKYWVEEFDIDGFRCDYAPGVPQNFWEAARAQLDEVKPVFMMMEDLGWVNEHLLDNAFDCNYNSDVYEALVLVAAGSKGADKIKHYLHNMPDGTFPMNYLDNHDVNSYDRTLLSTFKEDQLPLFFTYIYTAEGLPMLYTGDEVANDHALAFMDKDTLDWDATGLDYRPFLAKLSEIRSENEALYAGTYGGKAELLDAGEKPVLAFERKKCDNTVICVFNMSKNPHQADLGNAVSGGEEILLHGKGIESDEGGKVKQGVFELEAWEDYIIKK